MDDDRFDRWLEVNGVDKIGWGKTSDGRTIMRYYRGDGSEVLPGDSFPYDATLTPWTKPSGTA
jgi:hypothetical protein